MIDELDEEYFETQVAYEQSVTKMEVEDIMKMECDLFDEMIKQEGHDIHETSYEVVHEQMAQLDGTGVSTAIVEAMQNKLHLCFGTTEEEKSQEEDLD